MSIYAPGNLPPNLFPPLLTRFSLADLDFWVNEASGTLEYQNRCYLADQILICHQNQSHEFLIKGDYFKIKEGYITSLPKAIGFLTHLEELTIADNPFISEFPLEIGHLKNLKKLILSNLNISSLPPAIANCSNLKELHVINSPLIILPDEIGQLHQLELLNLSGNSELFSLPPSIRLLKNLKILNLENCIFSYLPKELFTLQKLFYLNVQGCPFSNYALERLQSYRNSVRLILYSQEKIQRAGQEENPLEKLLEKLSHLSGEKTFLEIQALLEHPDREQLKNFLSAFFNTLEMQQNINGQVIAKELVNYLVEAERNPRYRQYFFNSLKEAASQEEARVPITFFYLDIAKKMTQVNCNSLKNLYDHLVKIWITLRCFQVVQDRFNDFAVYDRTQIYLGYLSTLNDWHEFPLSRQVLGLFQSCQIPSIQLHTVSRMIERAKINLSAQAKFLATEDLWLEALQHLNPLDYAKKKKDPEALVKWTGELIKEFA